MSWGSPHEAATRSRQHSRHVPVTNGSRNDRRTSATLPSTSSAFRHSAWLDSPSIKSTRLAGSESRRSSGTASCARTARRRSLWSSSGGQRDSEPTISHGVRRVARPELQRQYNDSSDITYQETEAVAGARPRCHSCRGSVQKPESARTRKSRGTRDDNRRTAKRRTPRRHPPPLHYLGNTKPYVSRKSSLLRSP